MLSYIRIGNTMEIISVCLSACVHRAIVYYDFYSWGKQFISTVRFKICMWSHKHGLLQSMMMTLGIALGLILCVECLYCVTNTFIIVHFLCFYMFWVKCNQWWWHLALPWDSSCACSTLLFYTLNNIIYPLWVWWGHLALPWDPST